MIASLLTCGQRVPLHRESIGGESAVQVYKFTHVVPITLVQCKIFHKDIDNPQIHLDLMQCGHYPLVAAIRSLDKL
jgi:hypothetical protein